MACTLKAHSAHLMQVPVQAVRAHACVHGSVSAWTCHVQRCSTPQLSALRGSAHLKMCVRLLGTSWEMSMVSGAQWGSATSSSSRQAELWS